MSVKYLPGFIPNRDAELASFLGQDLDRIRRALDTVWDLDNLGRSVGKPREGMVRYFGEDTDEAQYYGAGHYGFTINDSTPAAGWWLPLFPVPTNYVHADISVPQALTGTWTALVSAQIDIREGYRARFFASLTAGLTSTATNTDMQYRFAVNGTPLTHIYQFTHRDPGAQSTVATLALEEDYSRVVYGSGGTVTLTITVEGMTTGAADVIAGIMDLREEL